MREDDGWPGLANDRRDTAQQFDVVEDLQIVGDGRMKVRAENLRRAFGFAETQAAGLRRVVPNAAAIAGGEIEVVDFPAALLSAATRFPP